MVIKSCSLRRAIVRQCHILWLPSKHFIQTSFPAARLLGEATGLKVCSPATVQHRLELWQVTARSSLTRQPSAKRGPPGMAHVARELLKKELVSLMKALFPVFPVFLAITFQTKNSCQKKQSVFTGVVYTLCAKFLEGPIRTSSCN